MLNCVLEFEFNVFVWFTIASWLSYPWRSIAVRTSQQQEASCDANPALPLWIALIICCELNPCCPARLHIWVDNPLIAVCTSPIEQCNPLASWEISKPLRWIADMISSRLESLLSIFNGNPALPLFPPKPPKPLFPKAPMRMNNNKIAKIPSPPQALLPFFPFINAKIFGSTPLCCIKAGSIAKMSLFPPLAPDGSSM